MKYELFIKPYITEERQTLFRNDYQMIHETTAVASSVVNWSKKKYKDYFKFTIVRDPLERFISGHKNKILNCDEKILENLKIKKSDFQKIKDINIFLDYINEYTIKRDQHFSNQKSLIPKLKYIDFVGKLKNMSEVERVLSEKTGRKITFPVINKSGGSITPILDIEKFYYLYRKDYKMLKGFYAPPKINMFRYILVYIKEKCRAIKEFPLYLPYFLTTTTDRLIGKIGLLIKSKNENLYFKLKKLLCPVEKF